MARTATLLVLGIGALAAAAGPSFADGDGKDPKSPPKNAPQPAGKDGDRPDGKPDARGDRATSPEALLKGLLASFESFDTDGDGRISEDELPLGDLFAKLDADRDGYLLRDEIRRALDGPRGRDGKGMDPGTPADETFADRARRIVARDPRFNAESRRGDFLRNFDKDPQDGKVQRKEYAGAEGDRVFRRFDANRDGALDERELLAFVREQIADLARDRRRPDRENFLYLFDLDMDRMVTREEYSFLRGPANTFTACDLDRDGVVTGDEIRYPERYRGQDRPGREAAGPAAATKSLWDLYDKDGNGRVTPEEFGGGEAVFRRLDRDRDGFLTAADR